MIYHAKLTSNEMLELEKQFLLHRGSFEEYTYKIGNIQVTGIMVSYSFTWNNNPKSKYNYDVLVDIERLE